MMPTLTLLPFVHALQQRGARVYTVGGTVRDELLGKTHKDLDLLVTGLPQKALIQLLRPHGRVQLIGRAFGVIKFLPRQWDGPPIDIALPRTEISTGTGHRDFQVTFDHSLPIEADLGRRDFTINAMAYDLTDGRLLDPFGGRLDMEQRLLRQVSPLAFLEDPLRMLRGVQLAARFGLQVEPATRHAMCTHAASITTVAPERVAEELRKLFQAAAPSHGFVLMHETGLLPHILPELSQLVGVVSPWLAPTGEASRLESDVFTHTVRRLDAVQHQEVLTHRGDLNLLLAALWCDSGLSEVQHTVPVSPPQLAKISADLAQRRLEALKMTTIGVRVELITTCIAQSAFEPSACASAAALRHFVHGIGGEAAFMVLDLRLADRLAHRPPQTIADLLDLRQRLQTEIDRKAPLSLKDLAVNGHDLQRLGIPSGPRLGQILQALLHRVLDDPACNTRDHLLALAQLELDNDATACGA
jgi:tRNA nucleotidyltransferase/poly(A) polymerase